MHSDDLIILCLHSHIMNHLKWLIILHLISVIALCHIARDIINTIPYFNKSLFYYVEVRYWVTSTVSWDISHPNLRNS